MHSSNKIIFLAELIGTFGLVVAATGSMVYDVSLGGIYGHHFVVAMHFIGLSIVVYAFGKYSMAHFNPAVTVGFFITKHVKGRQLPYYFAAQAVGAFLGSVFAFQKAWKAYWRCNRWNHCIGHFVFWFSFWCFNESNQVFGTSGCLRSDWRPLALFDYAIHWNNHSCSHLQGTLRTHEKHQHALERY